MPGLVVVGLGAYTESPVAKTSKIKKGDGRSRKDLELFVLGLISRGVSTPYDLKMSVGISPGASIPVLSRLKSSGWIRAGEEGSRSRQEYLITAKGTTLLQQSWKQLLVDPTETDLETVFRVATLARLMGESKTSIVSYMKRASAARSQGTAVRSHFPEPRAGDYLEVFRWMRSIATADRLRREAALLNKLAKVLRRLK
jgi:DNA-binding PadR family transcriptional regulator